MITTPTVSGKPGQAPTGLSCDLYPLIGSHSTWTDPRGPVTALAAELGGRYWDLTSDLLGVNEAHGGRSRTLSQVTGLWRSD